MIRPLHQKQLKLRSHRNSIMKEIKISEKLASFDQLELGNKKSSKQVTPGSSKTSKKNSFCDNFNTQQQIKTSVPRDSRMKVKLDEIIKLSSKFKMRAKVQHSVSRLLGQQSKQLIKSIFKQQIKTLPSQQGKQNISKQDQKEQFSIEENYFFHENNQKKRRNSILKRKTVPSVVPLSQQRQTTKQSRFYLGKSEKVSKEKQKPQQKLQQLFEKSNLQRSSTLKSKKFRQGKLKQFLKKTQKNFNKFWRKNLQNDIQKTSIYNQDCQKLQKFIRGESNFDNDADQYSDYVSLSEMNKTKQKFTTFAQIYRDVQTSKKMNELSFEMLKDNKLASVIYLNENLSSINEQKQKYYLEKLKIVK